MLNFVSSRVKNEKKNLLCPNAKCVFNAKIFPRNLRIFKIMTRGAVTLRVTSTGQEVRRQLGTTLIYTLKSVTVTEKIFVRFRLDGFHEIHD